jgi:Carbohydrate esterase, sialic acid-specific acetylesterase
MRIAIRFVKVPALLSALLAFAFSSHAAPGLTLGGHFVPQESLMVFIDMGNSAMSGRDKTPDVVTDPHLWKFEMDPTNYDWLAAREPVCVDAYQSLGAPLGGPIMPFLKRLLVDFPGYYFGVMQLSNSGWELKDHFLPGKDAVTALLTQANNLKANVTIAGIVSMLNNVEVQNKDTANYLQNVVAMVNNIRTSLGPQQYKGMAYTIPYVHAGYPVEAKDSPDGSIQYDTSHIQTKSIMRQVAQVPGTVSNSVVIPTDGLTVCMNCTPAGYYDHYDHNGNVGWGTRAADSVMGRGWIPPHAVSVSNNQTHPASLNRIPAMQKVLFDGSNWSVFDKAGKSFSVYSPNGKSVSIAAGAAIGSQKLLPGIYFVHTEVKN